MMELNAKFKIGDFVYIKQDIAIYNTMNEKDYFIRAPVVPSPRHILGIVYDECYSGVQVSYKTRGYSERGTEMITYLEIELTQDYNKGNEVPMK